MQNEKFNPVAHDDAFVAQMLTDPEAKSVYDELEEEYADINTVLRAEREAGTKMTTMTLEEMRAARERGESQSDWKRVHRMVQDGIEPAEDDASPNAAALMRADLVSRKHRD